MVYSRARCKPRRATFSVRTERLRISADTRRTWRSSSSRRTMRTTSAGCQPPSSCSCAAGCVAASPFKRTFVISICNDRPSYVPTKKAFGEGSYEITNARVKPGVGEMLVDAAVEQLKELKN